MKEGELLMHAGIFITSCVLTIGTLAVLGECTAN